MVNDYLVLGIFKYYRVLRYMMRKTIIDRVFGKTPYSVDELGNVYNMIGDKKSDRNHRGFRRVFLYLKGKARDRYIHLLVANAFLENNRNRQIYGYVTHLDGNKSNNHVDNLKWVSAIELAEMKVSR